MGETFGSLVTDGPLLVAAGVAALVGLISFASPCVLPLVPGYLAYVSGLVGTGRAGRRARRAARAGRRPRCAREVSPRARMVLGAVLFVLGFTAVFVAFGAAFGGLGRLMLEYSDVLNRVFGVVTILVGLGFLGWLPLLQRTKRLSARPAAGLAGAPLLGIVFGLGWTPCLGPTLSAVYSLAFTEATATRGARAGRRLLPGARHPVRARRARRPLGHGGDQLPAPARPHRDPGRWRRPRRRRAAAAHRGVDRDHAVAALLAGGHRLRGVAHCDGACDRATGGRPRRRSVGSPPRRRAPAALVAAADRHAHGDRAAVPARPRGGAGLAAAAARRCRRTRSPRTSPTTRRSPRCSTGSTCSTSSARRGSPRSTCCCSSR